MIKQYKSIYENYNFDIITPDITSTKTETIDLDDPSEDFYEEPVHRILIKDVTNDLGLYMNLTRDFGGLPRLGRKGEFTESVQNRFITSNGVKQIMYYPTRPQDMLYWMDGMIQVAEDMEDPYNEPPVLRCLCISAKKLKARKEKDEIQKDRTKEIKKMGKQKYTRGSGFDI